MFFSLYRELESSKVNALSQNGGRPTQVCLPTHCPTPKGFENTIQIQDAGGSPRRLPEWWNLLEKRGSSTRSPASSGWLHRNYPPICPYIVGPFFMRLDPYSASFQTYAKMSRLSHCYLGNQSVSNHPVLHPLRNGIFNLKAVAKELRPTCDFRKVLEHLSQAPFEPVVMACLHHLLAKTTFLIQFTFVQKGNRFFPVFVLDKNQTPAFTLGSVFLANLSEHSLHTNGHCPNHAIKWYLEQTKTMHWRI